MPEDDDYAKALPTTMQRGRTFLARNTPPPTITGYKLSEIVRLISNKYII